MTELQKELGKVFDDLSLIPVHGDYVEIMMSAREHLRRAFSLTKEKKEEDDG